MTRDDRPLDWLLANQRGVLSRAQVLSGGVTANALQHRTRRGGPWQRILPGVYLTFTGEPTRDQQAVAAMLYAGPDSVITGRAALRNYEIRTRNTPIVDVLVPAGRKRPDRQFVVLHRTRRMPREVTVDLSLRFAPVERAVADTVRGMGTLADARAVVAGAVQQRRCTVGRLAAELEAGPTRGSARLQTVLAEVADGIRSVAEADFRDLMVKSGLPLPLFNPLLYLGGEFLAQPDAWWPDAGVVGEVDSREWHLLPEHWERTMRRQARMASAGLQVLPFSPRQVRDEPDRVVSDLARALRAGRPVSGIVTMPAPA